MTSQDLNPSVGSVHFDGVTLDIIDHNGRRWITAEQLGRCLGYAPEKARTAVTNLYGRHKDEFTEHDTCAIKLMAQGQMREIRIFSDTGCNLASFFANTPNAKRFRAFAKEVLAARQQAQAVSHAHYAALLSELYAVRRNWEKLARYHALGLNNHEIGRLLNCNESTVRGWKARMAACGLIRMQRDATPQLDLFAGVPHA